MRTDRKFAIAIEAKRLCKDMHTNVSDEELDKFVFNLVVFVDKQVEEENKEKRRKGNA